MTLKEISAITGLSLATLSRASTGRGYIAPDKKQKALEAIELYGYKKRISRQKQSSDFSDVIMVITGGLQSNAYTDAIEALVTHCGRIHKRVFTALSNYDALIEEEYLRYAQSHGFYGVIMLSAVSTEGLIRQLRNCSCPVTLAYRYIPSVDTDVVIQDNYKMGMFAAQMFISAGHKRIGYLGGHAESSITQDKQMGLTDEIRSHGLEISPEDISYSDLSYSGGCEFAKKLLQSSDVPTAIFASNDLMAVGLINTLLSAGMSIPEDLSVICCDKTTASSMCGISLSLLYVDVKKVAEMALSMLKRRKSKLYAPTKQFVFEPIWQSGETVAAPRKRPGLTRR